MTTLSELYSSLDTLNSLGIDTTELKIQIHNKEQEILQNEIIPSIQEIVDVLCNQLRTDVEFTIFHRVQHSANIKSRIVSKDSSKIENTAKPKCTTSTSNKFYVKNQKGALGVGFFDPNDNSLKLLSGSKISGSTSNSFNRKEAYRDITTNYCKLIEGLYVLEKDYTFASPSTASSVVLGRSSNGWTDWKDENGICLDQIFIREKE